MPDQKFIPRLAKWLKDRFENHSPIIAIALLALPPLLWWLKSGQIVLITDFFFPLDPITIWKKSLSLWDGASITGSDIASTLYIPRFAMYSALAFLAGAKTNLTEILRLFFFANLFLLGLSAYLMFRELKPNSRWSALVVASIAMYNPYTVNMITDTPIFATLISSCLTIWLILRGIRVNQPISYGIGIGIIFFIFPMYNPSTSMLQAVYLIPIIIWIILKQNTKSARQAAWQLLGIGVLSFLAINARWLYAALIGVKSGASIPVGGLTNLDWATGVSRFSSFDRTIRLIGAWDWFDNYQGEPYIPFAPEYLANPLVMAVTWLLPLSLIYLIYLKRDRLSVALTAMALASAALAMGVNSWMAPIYRWLFENMPLFWLFRSPWQKFSLPLVLIYAIVGGLIVDHWLTHPVKVKFRGHAIAIGLIVISLITAYPLISGQRFWSKGDRQYLGGNRLEFPSYVDEFRQWIDQQPPGRLLGVEQLLYDNTNYVWGYSDVHPFLVETSLDKGFIYNYYSTPVAATPLIGIAARHLWQDDKLFQQTMNILGARYLLTQRDFNYKFYNATFNNQELEARLTKKGYAHSQQFGAWQIFDNPSAWPELFISDGLARGIRFDQTENIASSPTAFVETLDASKILAGLPTNLRDQNITIPIVEENSATYRSFTLLAQKRPRVLVFNQSYRPNWQAKLNNQVLEHHQLNVYANGYLIPAGQGGRITIEYAPQRLMNWLTIINFMALGASGLMILLLAVKRDQRLKAEK